MRKLLSVVFALALSSPVLADEWGGQNAGLPAIPGVFTNPVPAEYFKDEVACFSNVSGQVVGKPPCGPGTSKQVNFLSGTFNQTTLPNGVGGPESRVGIPVTGFFADSASPGGFSSFNGYIPLNDFATADSVSAVQDQFNAEVVALNTELQQQSTQLKHYAAQGVAQALAMAGVGDIDPDQKVSISMNFGTYEGQSAAAMGIAVRIDHHVSFNAGMSGMGSGTYGARAGFRIGW